VAQPILAVLFLFRHSVIPKLNQGEIYAFAHRKGPRIPLSIQFHRWSPRWRTPRTGHHPHFCFYYAQKETRARAAEKLGKDLPYFFSGDYLSACDLSTALSRLIPAVVRGDIRLKLARIVAYMFQTLV